MKRKRIMIVGPEFKGKRLISNKLNGENSDKKTSNIIYRKNTIDIPGSYIESPWRRINIISTQQDANLIIFISNLCQKKRTYPPNFAKSFRMKVIGLSFASIKDSKNNFNGELEDAKVDCIYSVSINSEEEINEFCEYILDYYKHLLERE